MGSFKCSYIYRTPRFIPIKELLKNSSKIIRLMEWAERTKERYITLTQPAFLIAGIRSFCSGTCFDETAHITISTRLIASMRLSSSCNEPYHNPNEKQKHEQREKKGREMRNLKKSDAGIGEKVKFFRFAGIGICGVSDEAECRMRGVNASLSELKT